MTEPAPVDTKFLRWLVNGEEDQEIIVAAADRLDWLGAEIVRYSDAVCAIVDLHVGLDPFDPWSECAACHERWPCPTRELAAAPLNATMEARYPNRVVGSST